MTRLFLANSGQPWKRRVKPLGRRDFLPLMPVDLGNVAANGKEGQPTPSVGREGKLDAMFRFASPGQRSGTSRRTRRFPSLAGASEAEGRVDRRDASLPWPRPARRVASSGSPEKGGRRN